MPSTTPTPRRHRDILSEAVALVLAVVVAIVALAWFDAAWSLALALAAAVAGVAITAIAIRRITADQEGSAALWSPRHAVLVFGCVAIATVAVATTAFRHDRTATQTGATAAGATQTVRDFLAQAVVDGNDYVACQYLTQAEQQRVTRLSPGAGSCRAALLQTPPAIAGATSMAGLRRLRMRTVVAGDHAATTVTGAGTPAVRFTLRRATGDDFVPFQAPRAAWRIDSGAQTLLGAAPPPAGAGSGL
jgi:hypothetical protein